MAMVRAFFALPRTKLSCTTPEVQLSRWIMALRRCFFGCEGRRSLSIFPSEESTKQHKRPMFLFGIYGAPKGTRKRERKKNFYLYTRNFHVLNRNFLVRTWHFDVRTRKFHMRNLTYSGSAGLAIPARTKYTRNVIYHIGRQGGNFKCQSASAESS